MSRLSYPIALALSLCSLACGDDGGGANAATPADYYGQWDVNTKLVAASDPTNPDYKVGDIRIDVWTFKQTATGASLTTKDGTIDGTISTTTGYFETVIDTGLNLKMKIMIECALTASRAMKGTIKAEYYGTFDNYIGLDAWTFEAVKK